MDVYQLGLIVLSILITIIIIHGVCGKCAVPKRPNLKMYVLPFIYLVPVARKSRIPTACAPDYFLSMLCVSCNKVSVQMESFNTISIRIIVIRDTNIVEFVRRWLRGDDNVVAAYDVIIGGKEKNANAGLDQLQGRMWRITNDCKFNYKDWQLFTTGGHIFFH